MDACQGAGKIWQRIRRRFPCTYMGADTALRTVGVKVDSVRLFDLPWEWDVIDVDTYGEPWRHWEAICRTCRQPVTVFLTVGIVRMFGWSPKASPYIHRALGCPDETPPAIESQYMEDMHAWLLSYAAKLYGRTIEDCRRVVGNSRVSYYGCRLLPGKDTV